tara:strand:+ start:2585 stop:3436 length:852 start_codon:yes stop_codon:yes gene_type:complete
MTTRDKLEKVLEYIINEESEKASDLLHDVFVEKARTVYEDLMGQDEDLEEYEEEINSDELEEGDEESEMDMGMDDAEADVADDMAMDVAPDMEDDMEDAPDEIESNFEKVEDAIEELRQSFQAILGDEMKDEDEMESIEMEEEEVGAMESVEEEEEETTTESAETEEEELEEDLNEEEEEEEELDEDFDYVDEAATMTAVKAPTNTSEKSHSPVAKAGNKPGGPVSASMMKDAGAEGKKAHMAPKMMNTGNVNVPGAKQKLANVAMPKSSEAAGNTTSPTNGM